MTFSTHRSDSAATLVGMLAYRRPAGSKTERRFIREYIAPLGMTVDKLGNLYKRIGDAPVMWSCHTDTVHRMGGMQTLEVAGNLIGIPKGSISNCLGADDTAGIWLMREMILAKRPGLYLFHRAEEIGGVGSSHIATKTPELLKGIDCAIAFDRRGTNSVITHQGYGRCCSDAFAASLCEQLMLGYKPDDTGVFTDTANYTDIVGECTNVSVGYFAEHTRDECLDMAHVLALRDALMKVDAAKLTYNRAPGEDDWQFANDNGLSDDFDWCPDADQEPTSSRRKGTLTELILDHPAEVADLLEEYGHDWSSLAEEIWQRGQGRRK